MSLFASRCAHDCMVMCVVEVCYLAVHNEVADAASEVFVLKLGVDVWDVLVHTAKLEHVAHVQVSKTHKGMDVHTVYTPALLAIRAHSIHIIQAPPYLCHWGAIGRMSLLENQQRVDTFKLYTISAHR